MCTQLLIHANFISTVFKNPSNSLILQHKESNETILRFSNTMSSSSQLYSVYSFEVSTLCETISLEPWSRDTYLQMLSKTFRMLSSATEVVLKLGRLMS